MGCGYIAQWEPLSDEEFEEEGRENQTQSTLPLPVGFDRLRSAGFSDEDIASLRPSSSDSMALDKKMTRLSM